MKKKEIIGLILQAIGLLALMFCWVAEKSFNWPEWPIYPCIGVIFAGSLLWLASQRKNIPPASK